MLSDCVNSQGGKHTTDGLTKAWRSIHSTAMLMRGTVTHADMQQPPLRPLLPLLAVRAKDAPPLKLPSPLRVLRAQGVAHVGLGYICRVSNYAYIKMSWMYVFVGFMIMTCRRCAHMATEHHFQSSDTRGGDKARVIGAPRRQRAARLGSSQQERRRFVQWCTCECCLRTSDARMRRGC